MKRGFIILFVVFAVNTLSAQDANLLWDRANTAYVNGDYNGAIMEYDSIVALGKESYKLYYNLGNAHFKEGHTGLAILNYNRALRLAPSDNDVRYNLRIANSYVKDNIESVPEFIIAKWLRVLRNSFGSNTWAILSLGTLFVSLAFIVLFMLFKGSRWRKAWFYTAIISFVCFILSGSFASIQKCEIVSSSRAIVMDGAVSVKSSPEKASKEIFIIHEGTAVTILGRLGDWCEISIADGKQGWIEKGSIEAI